jgi:hypothetical protein
MKLCCKFLRTQKAGNSFSECEDWFCPPEDGVEEAISDIDPKVGKANFAIADGATEGMLSSKWAELVSKAFFRQGSDDFTVVMRRAKVSWQGWHAAYLRRRQRLNPIKWYEEPGLRKGAFSTLLGLSFLCPIETEGSWVGMAVGDSCVFQIRQSQLLHAFPIANSSDFSNSPVLINSNTPEKSDPSLCYGKYTIGDEFFLATDALSQWFLKVSSDGGKPWTELLNFKSMGSHDSFVSWIDSLRCKNLIRNDDVALVSITVEP